MTETWWALADKRGKLLRSFVLGTPMLFLTRREAENWAKGSEFMNPAPEGTRAVRVTVGKGASESK